MSRTTTLFVSTGLVALFVAYVVLRIVTPSDGARMQPGSNAWAPDGIVLTPLIQDKGGLVAGDTVIVVEEVPLEAWAADMLTRDLPRPAWAWGATASYVVRRGSDLVPIDQPLGPYPLWAVFRADWGAFSFAIANLLVAAFAYSRRSGDPAVRAFLLGAASMLAASTWSIGLQVSDIVGGLGFVLYEVTTIAAFSLVWTCVLHFVLVFPRPQPWLAGRRWVIPTLYAVPFIVNGLWVVVSRPTSVSVLDWFAGLGRATSMLQLIYSILIVVAAIMAVRFARDPVSRAQVRWVLFALVLAITFGLVVALIPQLLTGGPFVSMNVVAVFGLIMPVSMTVAIFRYRLFNIDLIIRRTTQFAIVTAVLAVVYFGSVVVLQRLFADVTGQTSTVAIVLSTLLIAALFLPLRRRVQDGIDRRFYRQKYDAEKVLNQFAATVRDETDLDALTAELARVIQETMQPEFVQVWLRPPDDPRLAHQLPEATKRDYNPVRQPKQT